MVRKKRSLNLVRILDYMEIKKKLIYIWPFVNKYIEFIINYNSMTHKLTVPVIVEFKNNINFDIDKCIEIINNSNNLTQKSDHIRMISQMISYYDRMIKLYSTTDIRKGDINSDEEVDSDIFSSDDSDDICKYISNGENETDDMHDLFHGKFYRQDLRSDIIRKQLLGIDEFEIPDDDVDDVNDDNDEDEFDYGPDSSVDMSDYHMEKIKRPIMQQEPIVLPIPNKNMFKFIELVPEIEIINTADEINYEPLI